MTKYSDIKYINGFDTWFEMLIADKKCTLQTMHRNMAADIEAGYNPMGNSIQRQITEINAYKADFDSLLDKIALMDESKIERFCYMQLLKSGAIE